MSKETKKMMTEERFFSKVRDTFQGYAPEVPPSVYAGMRRKLWLSNFLRFNASRFNLWYLLLAAGGVTLASLSYTGHSAMANKAIGNTPQLIITPTEFVANQIPNNNCQPVEALANCLAMPGSCVSKSSTATKNEVGPTPEFNANANSTSEISDQPAGALVSLPGDNTEIQSGTNTNGIYLAKNSDTPSQPEITKGFGAIADRDKVTMKMPVVRK